MQQGLAKGHLSYRGRSPQPRDGKWEKSAEAIVIIGDEPQTETAEVSQK
jgi:hypothetical protein